MLYTVDAGPGTIIAAYLNEITTVTTTRSHGQSRYFQAEKSEVLAQFPDFRRREGGLVFPNLVLYTDFQPSSPPRWSDLGEKKAVVCPKPSVPDPSPMQTLRVDYQGEVRLSRG